MEKEEEMIEMDGGEERMREMDGREGEMDGREGEMDEDGWKRRKGWWRWMRRRREWWRWMEEEMMEMNGKAGGDDEDG